MYAACSSLQTKGRSRGGQTRYCGRRDHARPGGRITCSRPHPVRGLGIVLLSSSRRACGVKSPPGVTPQTGAHVIDYVDKSTSSVGSRFAAKSDSTKIRASLTISRHWCVSEVESLFRGYSHRQWTNPLCKINHPCLSGYLPMIWI